MRIVFMGTPAFALPTLKALHSSGHDIVAVYTQPPRPAGRGQKDTPSPVHQYAAENNLPVFTPVSLKTPEAQAEFVSHKADIAVVVAYGLLLPKPILTAYPMGCINVHPSKLPRWRGAAPIQRTIMAGDTETAICIMQMDEGLDTGDVLLQKDYDVPESFNAGALHDMLAADAGSLILETLKQLQSGTAIRKTQDTQGVTYAKKITKEECHIDWSKSAEEIRNLIRGLSPTHGAIMDWGGKPLKIFEADIVQNPDGKKRIPSVKIRDKKNSIIVACKGDNYLKPTLVQQPGKKRMGMDEFILGNDIGIE